MMHSFGLHSKIDLIHSTRATAATEGVCEVLKAATCQSVTVERKMESMSNDRPFIWRSKLADHKRIGKQLVPPFQHIRISTEQIFWWRDILPEFLWIDSLVQTYGNLHAWALFGDFLSEADRFNPDANEILDGTVSAFRLVPAEKRKAFREELAPVVKEAIVAPFGTILKLYPDCPMSCLPLCCLRQPRQRFQLCEVPCSGLCRVKTIIRDFAAVFLFIGC